MQLKNSKSLKQRAIRIGLGCILVLGLPFLLYFGYCWGWWGRHNLLLQYYFQCKCPASSEQARYPKEAEVIVSACHNFYDRLSPTGRKLYVREENSEFTSSYLLDLQTEERVSIESKGSSFLFLNDDILLRQDILLHRAGGHILDGLTGKQYPIETFNQLRPDAYSDGRLNLDILASAFLQADRIFLLDDESYPLIVLSSDFRTQPENNFVIYYYELPESLGTGNDRLESFLKQNNIPYNTAPPTSFWDSFPGEVLSRNGRFVARNDGIYLAENNQRIVAGVPHLLIRGWSNDGRAVYSANYIEPCLFQVYIPMIDDLPSCKVVVPQPVLALKVPEEFLVSAQP